MKGWYLTQGQKLGKVDELQIFRKYFPADLIKRNVGLWEVGTHDPGSISPCGVVKPQEEPPMVENWKSMFPAGLEPATFRVWGGRDNHYTTETTVKHNWSIKNLSQKRYVIDFFIYFSVGTWKENPLDNST